VKVVVKWLLIQLYAIFHKHKVEHFAAADPPAGFEKPGEGRRVEE
jgi:hypothetical protein